MIKMIDARVKLNRYTNRVFAVVKAKYELINKSEAINKFVELYGNNEVEPEINEKYIQKLNNIEKNTLKKGLKKMDKKELDDLFK